MKKALGSMRQEALINALKEKRSLAGLTQVELADLLKVQQSFVARMESGQRRVDVVEFLYLSETLKFDAVELIKKISAVED